MLRSVAALVSVEIGQYCIADMVDTDGVLRRLDIEHADASRGPRLRVVCQETKFPPGSRVPALLTTGHGDLVPRVTDAIRGQLLADVVLLREERVRSYMAMPVHVAGSPIAALTALATQGTRRYGALDLELLGEIAEWTGLGLENALRRGHRTALDLRGRARFDERTTPSKRS